MQFTKHGTEYVSGDYTIRKRENMRYACQWRYPWTAYYKGAEISSYETCKVAKAACDVFEHNRLSEIRTKADSEAAKRVIEERRQKAAATIEYSTDLGVTWWEWAELRLGTTPAELRQQMAREADRREIERLRRDLADIDFDDHQDLLEELIDMLNGRVITRDLIGSTSTNGGSGES